MPVAAESRMGRTPRLPVTPFAPVDLKNFRPEVVAIGVSTGGPNALACMLPELPDNLNLPILIVQHMPSAFTRSLAEGLDARSAFTVKEAEQGETIERNIVYIAPGGRQMKVGLAPDGTRKIIVLTDDPPENNCKPSVDYLFRSVAEHYEGEGDRGHHDRHGVGWYCGSEGHERGGQCGNRTGRDIQRGLRDATRSH